MKNALHFSRDVVFNESVSGRLSSSHTISLSVSPDVSVSPSRPVHLRIRTPAGQDFADTVAARDLALASHRSRTVYDESSHPPLSLSAILDFVSLLDFYVLPFPVDTWSLADEPLSVFLLFAFS